MKYTFFRGVSMKIKSESGKEKRYLAVRIIGSVFSFICFLAFFSASWYKNVYGDIGFDAILFTLTTSFGGVNEDLVGSWVLTGLVPAVIATAFVTVAVFIVLFRKQKNKYVKIISTVLVFVLSFVFLSSGAQKSKLPQWISSKLNTTTIFEDYYVSPESVEISFPEEKKNLIYIYLESMETSYFSKEEGGGLEFNAIPELYSLAENNTNFSQNSSVGGGRDISGATWTAGAMISQTAGIPLMSNVGIDDDKWGNFFSSRLPGVKSLTDILSENGYYQSLMVGSDSRYGSRKQYFEQHGISDVFDYYSAIEDGIIPEGYWEWWGMEDKYLYTYAKQKLTDISQKDAPFAFTMLTVDTHHVDGFKCSECDDEYEEQYSNVLSCASKQLYSFIKWIEEQPFYENTTVIITGDHCTMDNQYIGKNIEEGYVRRLYNCFINPAFEPENKKNREFVSFDMFPTTLGAIGCTIEGNRLGLGTNLFSEEKTLAELLGFEYLDSEIVKTSNFYDNAFVKNVQ